MGIVIYTLWAVVTFVAPGVNPREIAHVVTLAFITLIRVVVLIAIASVIWVPIGILIGLRPDLTRVFQPVAQFLGRLPGESVFPTGRGFHRDAKARP